MIIARKTTQPQYEEKLYSTGDSELDDLLEKAFSEGYEYAQKEFGFNQLIRNMAAKDIKKKRHNIIEDAKKNWADVQKFAAGLALEGKDPKAAVDHLRINEKRLAREILEQKDKLKSVASSVNTFFPKKRK